MRPDTILRMGRHVRPIRSETARILMNAQARLDQLSAGALPFPVKIDAMFDVLLQVAHDLDHLHRKQVLTRLSVQARRVQR